MFRYLETEFPNIYVVNRNEMPSDIPAGASFRDYQPGSSLDFHIRPALVDPNHVVVIVCDNEDWRLDANADVSSSINMILNPFVDAEVAEERAKVLETPLGNVTVTDSKGELVEFTLAKLQDNYPLLNEEWIIDDIIKSEGLYCLVLLSEELEIGETYSVDFDGPRLKPAADEGGTTVLGVTGQGRSFALSALDPNRNLDYNKAADRKNFVAWRLQTPKNRKPNGFKITLLDHKAPEIPIFAGWVEGTTEDHREAVTRFVLV